MNENARPRVFAAGSKGKDEKVRSGGEAVPVHRDTGDIAPFRRDFFRLIARHPPSPDIP